MTNRLDTFNSKTEFANIKNTVKTNKIKVLFTNLCLKEDLFINIEPISTLIKKMEM